MRIKIFDGRYEFDTTNDNLYSMSKSHFGRAVEKRYSGGTQGWYITTRTGGRPQFHTVSFIRNTLAPVAKSAPQTPNVPTTQVTGKFIIGSRQGVRMSISSEPKIHTNVNEAKQEAERLARLDPAKAFVVLAVVGEVQAQGIAWR